MARDRLAARKNAAGAGATGQESYGDPSYPSQSSYPPQQQQQQPQPQQQQRGYAPEVATQQYTPVPGMGAGGQGGVGYGGGAQAGQQQQQQYPMGGVNGNGAGGEGDFWSQLSGCQSTLNEMQDMIQQVRQAHIASLSRLDTTPNSAAARETDQLIASTRDLTSHNKDKIKQLNKMAKDKAQKQQVAATKSRFMSLLNEYQVVEKEFRKKVRERGERQFKIVKPDATPEEVQQVLETDNPQIFSQALLSSNRYGDARGAFKEVQERHEDIKKIEKTLTELAQMFNEMSMLVEQQDETINVIETQANSVNVDMEQGLKHTEKAVTSARKARRKKWICFWISVLILLIVVAVVVGVICGQGKCK